MTPGEAATVCAWLGRAKWATEVFIDASKPECRVIAHNHLSAKRPKSRMTKQVRGRLKRKK